jgi:anti-sigma B factor antagonist
MSPKRFEPSRPEPRPGPRRPASLRVTGRSGRIGEYTREAVRTVCQINLSDGDEVRVLSVSGQLDISCGDRFLACLREVRDADPADLVVDIREVTFIDSTGLSMLLKADSLARQNNFRLQVVRSEAQIVQAVLEATGVEQFLPLVDEPPAIAG